MKTTLNRLEAIKDLIQEAVDKGVTSVEQVHRAIADLPFAALEQSGLAQPQAEKPRELVGQSIGMVYEGIRRVNSEIGTMVTGLFESLEDHAEAQATLSRREPAAGAAPRPRKRASAGSARKRPKS